MILCAKMWLVCFLGHVVPDCMLFQAVLGITPLPFCGDVSAAASQENFLFVNFMLFHSSYLRYIDVYDYFPLSVILYQLKLFPFYISFVETVIEISVFLIEYDIETPNDAKMSLMFTSCVIASTSSFSNDISVVNYNSPALVD